MPKGNKDDIVFNSENETCKTPYYGFKHFPIKALGGQKDFYILKITPAGN